MARGENSHKLEIKFDEENKDKSIWWHIKHADLSEVLKKGDSIESAFGESTDAVETIGINLKTAKKAELAEYVLRQHMLIGTLMEKAEERAKVLEVLMGDDVRKIVGVRNSKTDRNGAILWSIYTLAVIGLFSWSAVQHNIFGLVINGALVIWGAVQVKQFLHL